MTDRCVYGWYGKVPAVGDFIRSDLSQDFVETWDRWMQAVLPAGREALGNRWQNCYLEAPIWRFAIAPGLCGLNAVAGVVMPSVDRVGRQFPLCLAAESDAALWSGCWSSYAALVSAFETLEAIALNMLEDSASVAGLASALAEAPRPMKEPATSLIPVGTSTAVIAGNSVAEALAANALAARSAIWVSLVGGQSRVLITSALPRENAEIEALFDLNAPCWVSPQQKERGAR
ncbi:MAG: type VI secretion system-associated protein TagF [Paracoccaceae bacterium]